MKQPAEPPSPPRRALLALPLMSLLPLLGAVPAARAALAVGASAPDFTAEAALAGKAFSFSLAQALRRGPVVLYFYPKAFTSGCTLEAKAFADATPDFEALGATVVGLSSDDIDTLKRFSTEACRDRFAVAADPEGRVIRAYDAALWRMRVADRISYAIGPDARVMAVHASMNPDGHVERMLQAVREWRRTQPAAPAR